MLNSSTATCSSVSPKQGHRAMILLFLKGKKNGGLTQLWGRMFQRVMATAKKVLFRDAANWKSLGDMVCNILSLLEYVVWTDVMG